MRSRRRGVVGFDLSLRGPAACYIPPGWELGDWGALGRWTMRPDDVAEGDHVGRYRRLQLIVAGAERFVLDCCTPHLFVEDYAFSKRSTAVTRLAELGGAVRLALYCAGRVLVPVPASQARKLLLGKLPLSDVKEVVKQQLLKHGAPFGSDDECDAFCIANWGLSEIGFPFLSLA